LWNGNTNDKLTVDEIENPIQITANDNKQQNERLCFRIM
jgi:hypothetical protein